MEDWAKFVQDQLRGARGQDGLLKAETYAKLHSPVGDAGYALGWSTPEREWGGGAVLHHSGSNTLNRANVWLAPKRDFAVLVCANQGGDASFDATDETVVAAIDLLSR
jgi:CubicO group peptidase (beta-lactamase class C family)